MWGASPPRFLRAFPGPRGRPDFKNAPQKIRPDCLQIPRRVQGYTWVFSTWFLGRPEIVDCSGFGRPRRPQKLFHRVWGFALRGSIPGVWAGFSGIFRGLAEGPPALLNLPPKINMWLIPWPRGRRHIRLHIRSRLVGGRPYRRATSTKWRSCTDFRFEF
jgi:hypothetical protein